MFEIIKNKLIKFDQNSYKTQDILLLIFGIAIISTLITNYSYGDYCHIPQLPMIFRQLDSNYLHNDYFVTSSIELGPRFYYIKILSLLAILIPLQYLFLILTCLSNFLIAVITYFTAKKLFKESKLTPILAFIFVLTIHNIDLGNACFIKGNYLNPRHLIMPFVLLGIYFGLFGKPVYTAIICSICSFVHPLVAGMTGIITILANFTIDLKESFINKIDKNNLKVMLLNLVYITIIMAFIIIFWMIPNKTSLSPNDFIHIFAYFRNPHHYIPTYFHIRDYISFICVLITISFIVYYYFIRKEINTNVLEKIVTIIIIIILLCLGGYLFVEIIPLRIWTTIQPFRYIFIIEWFLIIFISRLVVIYLTERNNNYFISGVIIILLSGINQSIILAAIISFEFLKAFFQKRFIRYNLILSLLYLMILVIIVKLIPLNELFHSINIWVFAFPYSFFRIILLVSLTYLVLLNYDKKNASFLPACIALLMAVIISCFISFYPETYYKIAKKTGLLPEITLNEYRNEQDLRSLIIFVREKTNKNAIFLTPPEFGIFRLYAERAIVVNFKSIPCQDWGMFEWKQRFDNCYGKTYKLGFDAVSELNNNYKAINDKKLKEITLKYNINYAILYNESNTNYPVIFNNNTYKVVKTSGNSKN
ncbi:MAG: DUF6798 domain-containing protein [Cyanobacteriota bacterium]